MDIDSVLLCASGAAYDIDPATGAYDPDGNRGGTIEKDKVFAPNVGWVGTPRAFAGATMNGGPLINACLVGTTSDAIIVAFRGTIPPAKTLASIEDWLQDFFAEPESRAGMPGAVHSGFYDGLMSIYPQILDAVRQIVATTGSSYKVYVTGHSKGGGLAPLAAYKLSQDGVSLSGVVTFAGPKCGDAVFQAAYDAQLLARHRRYENYGDIVPLCPPSDDFIDLLAQAFKYLSPIIYELLKDASGWNYVSLGNEAYIEHPKDGAYSINDSESIDRQVSDFILNAGWNLDDLGAALEDAHTIRPHHGYFGAVCPNLPSDAAAPNVTPARELETRVDPRARQAPSPTV